MKKEQTDVKSKLEALFEAKRRIDLEIDELLHPTPKAVLPATFNVNREILQIMEENPQGKSTLEVVSLLQTKFPAFGITRPKVSAAITYLASPEKNELERVDRGMYRKKQTEAPSP